MKAKHAVLLLALASLLLFTSPVWSGARADFDQDVYVTSRPVARQETGMAFFAVIGFFLGIVGSFFGVAALVEAKAAQRQLNEMKTRLTELKMQRLV